MNKDIKEIIYNEFQNEIHNHARRIGEETSDFLIKNIDLVSHAIKENLVIEEYFPIENKRKIFDSSFTNSSLEMLWFTSIYLDNIDLYKFTCSGLSYKKGRSSELIPAIKAQDEYLKTFKPSNILNWIVESRKTERDIFSNLSTTLLYCYEHGNKKNKNVILKSPLLYTNNLDFYNFLNQTKDNEFFEKLILKHQKNSAFAKNNFLLKQSDADNNTKILNFLFDQCTLEKIPSIIERFKNFEFNNAASFFSHHYLNNSLPLKTEKKKLKI